MNTGLNILKHVLTKWRIILSINAVFFGVGVALFCFFLLGKASMAVLLLIGSIGTAVGILVFKPYKITKRHVARWIDNSLPEAQNSTFLLTASEDLSAIAQIQQIRVAEIITDHKGKISWPASIKSGLLALLLFPLLGYSLNTMILSNRIKSIDDSNIAEFSPVNADTVIVPLKILDQQVKIDYPKYTRKKTEVFSEMSIKALEGSIISWQLTFNRAPETLYIELLSGKRLPFKKTKDSFTTSLKLIDNGYYKLVYTDQDSVIFESQLYQLKMLIDEPPEIINSDIERFTLLEYDDKKDVSFSTLLTDDYGLNKAEIVATVSKGSGESVKFREERMSFDQALKIGSTNQSLKKSFNLDDLKMTPGDELYFYIEAYDNKLPIPNRSRTQTYFVTIRDTTEVPFSLAGSLGVDLMPEYFRSQRQIIIDTEKLIKNRLKMDEHDFNATSNELGFDQKSLRLKYGQFMGEEFETGITESAVPEELGEDHDHEHDHGEDDPLAEYSHKHDTENEHNLVPEEEKEEDPLEEYKHAHDDPEEATLYTVSIKGKLRAAMAEMWDAELYLRLYEPEKSLPYQYRALELIKEIKNHARIYVQRIGFDPPPIKEDRRLTGELDQVETLTKLEERKISKSNEAIVAAIQYINEMMLDVEINYDAAVFERAGQEIATIALEEPGKHFETLQMLQDLRTNRVKQEDLKKHLITLQGKFSTITNTDKSKLVVPFEQGDKLNRAYKSALNKHHDK